MFVNAPSHESIAAWSRDSRHGWGINGATAPGGAVERNWANIRGAHLAPASMRPAQKRRTKQGGHLTESRAFDSMGSR